MRDYIRESLKPLTWHLCRRCGRKTSETYIPGIRWCDQHRYLEMDDVREQIRKSPEVPGPWGSPLREPHFSKTN
jgi:hypothetical protein